jgi:hypothetical protein
MPSEGYDTPRHAVMLKDDVGMHVMDFRPGSTDFLMSSASRLSSDQGRPLGVVSK